MTEALQKKVDRAIKLIKSASGDDDHCCGCCQHFEYEDTDGYGYCSLSTNHPETHCSDVCKGFIHE